jgi:serine/threonine protein kinase/Tfp pilus assembly protein PilF
MFDSHESHHRQSPDMRSLVQEQIDSWRDGEEPNASRVLAEHPELRGAKSLVLDLALAEYTLRTEAGDKIVKSDFCERFPAYRQSIAKMLEVQEFLDTCPKFAIDDASRWPIPGDEFLGFEIVEPLGRGGLARVFLARELSLGNRQVVIKVSRFSSREAHTLGKLSHASIMPVHSVQHDANGEWTAICMPLLGAATGVDLLDAAFAKDATRDGELVHRVAESTRPLAVALAIAPSSEQFEWNLTYQQAIARMGLQLAEALVAAHAGGILHRDIKPSNILLAWSGRPLLLDFNLSSDAATTLQGVGGTLAYMAPELIASVLTDKGVAARRFDPRYDIYSLGAVLYELLTGRLPLKPANADDLPLDAYQPWLDCKREPVAPPSGQVEADTVNQPLYDIVLKCLAFDPAERFGTAEELAGALRDYLDSTKQPTPSLPLSPSPPPLTHSAARRAVFAGLLALAAVALVGVVSLWSSIGVPRSTPVELLYQQGLDEYDAGDYTAAVETFTKCLERKSGWHEALFGRAQAFRKLEKWHEARSDYKALSDINPMWSATFAGYCQMQANENSGAFTEFLLAYNLGQRDISFLLNYARVQVRRHRFPDALKIYSEVLALDPENRMALSNRALVDVARVTDHKKNMPSAEYLQDAKEYYRLESDPLKRAFCAAIVFGEAARKDSSHVEKAVSYLTEALNQKLPLEATLLYSAQLKPLVPLVDQSTLEHAVHDPKFRVSFTPAMEFSDTPHWNQIQQFNSAQAKLATHP